MNPYPGSCIRKGLQQELMRDYYKVISREGGSPSFCLTFAA